MPLFRQHDLCNVIFKTHATFFLSSSLLESENSRSRTSGFIFPFTALFLSVTMNNTLFCNIIQKQSFLKVWCLIYRDVDLWLVKSSVCSTDKHPDNRSPQITSAFFFYIKKTVLIIWNIHLNTFYYFISKYFEEQICFFLFIVLIQTLLFCIFKAHYKDMAETFFLLLRCLLNTN